MDNFFPPDVKESADKLGSDWLKGAEFEAGLTLQLAKPLEKVMSNNPKYGAQEDDYLVENNLLDVGQCFLFTFKDESGKERKFDTKSTPFFIGFKQVEELGVGDWVKIQREGKGDKTRYTVTKVDAPALSAKVDFSKDVPFDEPRF